MPFLASEQGGGPGCRWIRAAALVTGILASQLILFGPSLLGRKILLPLDLLALAEKAEFSVSTRGPIPDATLADLVLGEEPARMFAAKEVRAGRLPLWNPHQFSGAPFPQGAAFYPPSLLYYLFPVPYTLAWLQVLHALVAGVGAYAFSRRVLGAGWWPSFAGGVCYPLTGFLTVWQGYEVASAAAWLPLVLVAAAETVRCPRGPGGPALAMLLAVAGSCRLDVAAQILIVATLLAALELIRAHRRDRRVRLLAGRAAATGLALLLGLLLLAPKALPTREYMRTSARLADRAAGLEERPPVGIGALPETVLPGLFGVHQAVRRAPLCLSESSTGAYSGLFAALFLVPLSFRRRSRRSTVLALLAAGLLGLAWQLDLAPVVTLMRMPIARLLPHNRLVFVTSFASLALAVLGLDVLFEGAAPRRRADYVFLAASLAISLWAAARLLIPPREVAVSCLAFPALASSFARVYARGALAGLAAAVGWWSVGDPRGARARGLLAAALLFVELTSFASGLRPQCDPGLYYPKPAILAELEAAPRGRVLVEGLTLPPNLIGAFGYDDARGYDGVDPSPYVPLIASLSSTRLLRYERLYGLSVPFVDSGGGPRPPAILDMLGVRYVIGSGPPPLTSPLGPAATPQSARGLAPATLTACVDGHWLVENPAALPRVFLPERVDLASAGEQWKALRDPAFVPARQAFVEEPVDLPAGIRGAARIVREAPNEIAVAYDMETPGLLVVGDRWDAGWRAERNGEATSILKVNLVLRGVVVPRGRGTVVLTYLPESLVTGALIAAAAGLSLCGWVLFTLRSRARG